MRNRWVNFKIKDVYVPDPAQILLELHGDDLLQGKIIDVSDSGFQKNAFAVVEVEGLAQPLVVPMDRIKGASVNDPILSAVHCSRGFGLCVCRKARAAPLRAPA